MKWKLKISDDTSGVIYEDEEIIGEVTFIKREDWLKFLSVIPRNRIKVLNAKILMAPICVNQHGSISITKTVRALMSEYSASQIAEKTGFGQKIVTEIYSKLKAGKL